MRDIKFRGYNNEFCGDHFVYGETILFQEYRKQWVMLIENELGEAWVDIEAPQQYTGLKDKNGKEIYEGDIVIHNGKAFTVKYFDKYTRFACSNNTIENKLPMAMINFDVCEVIGNIYENPDLLNQQ